MQRQANQPHAATRDSRIERQRLKPRDGLTEKAAEVEQVLKSIIEKQKEKKQEQHEGPQTLSMMLECSCCKQKTRPKGETLERVLRKSFPVTGYSNTVRWEPVHWGQLKLLLSEIEFLTPYWGELGYHVIYAGASPGIHMPILAEMFPDIEFTLIDPQPSMIAVGEYRKINVMQDKMTEGLARSYAESSFQNKILFISDVRIGPEDDKETSDEMQRRIHEDMMNQQKWLQIMNPVLSILKFRLPWDPPGGKTSYLDGIVYFPVFGKRLTHEARLVVNRGAGVIDYDNSLYEGWMAHFNQFRRPATYNYYGQKGCFDCTSFRKIVREYLEFTGSPNPSIPRNYDPVNQKCIEIVTKLKRFQNEWGEMRKDSEPLKNPHRGSGAALRAGLRGSARRGTA